METKLPEGPPNGRTGATLSSHCSVQLLVVARMHRLMANDDQLLGILGNAPVLNTLRYR